MSQTSLAQVVLTVEPMVKSLVNAVHSRDAVTYDMNLHMLAGVVSQISEGSGYEAFHLGEVKQKLEWLTLSAQEGGMGNIVASWREDAAESAWERQLVLCGFVTTALDDAKAEMNDPRKRMMAEAAIRIADKAGLERVEAHYEGDGLVILSREQEGVPLFTVEPSGVQTLVRFPNGQESTYANRGEALVEASKGAVAQKLDASLREEASNLLRR
jgi:hypothetical protein